MTLFKKAKAGLSTQLPLSPANEPPGTAADNILAKLIF
jgi:hypothetical protein